MEDRFIFNAIVTGYYDIDTPDEYKEVEPRIYLEDVDVFSDEIGIDYDRLFDAVQKQLKLEKLEINQVMQFFEDNSNAISEEYVTIKPDKILQCTGLKDKNGKLIHEGDILYNPFSNYRYVVNFGKFTLNYTKPFSVNITGFYITYKETIKNEIDSLQMLDLNNIEVIGNVYQNPELLED